MRKTVIFILALLFLTTARIIYAQPYLCGSNGLVYSDQSFCNSSCGSTCQSLNPQTAGTSYACPSSGYKSFVYSPTTGYTYALTTNTGFWGSFNQPGNNPSLVIIPDATINQPLAFMLSYYGVSKAWIGAYDSSMSTSYNTVDPQNYIWWNNSAINYSNWASGQPNNLLDSHDIGVVPGQGNHWAYMSSNGQWFSDGYHYNYPSSQNYAPYYNALVQWNGPLSCVNGVAPTSPPVTPPDITNTKDQYCNGQNNCYMCTDTSQCTPENECPAGYHYVSANNDCEAPASCPAGGTLNTSSGSCTVPASGATCPQPNDSPNMYTYNTTSGQCEGMPIQGCTLSTATLSNGICTVPATKTCLSGYSNNFGDGTDCEANPTPHCNVGSPGLINGQNQCIANPTYTCPDAPTYTYDNPVSGKCAYKYSIQCPNGGQYVASANACELSATTCPDGYTKLGSGLCSAPAPAANCVGSGQYQNVLGACVENAVAQCPTSDFKLDPTTGYCLAPISQYQCPGGPQNYNPTKRMCVTPPQGTCPEGYTQTSNGSQCQISANNYCPAGSYDETQHKCIAQPISYVCPSGYTSVNGACMANSSCPPPATDYNAAEQACSTPLQPCSPASNNMQQCTQTSSGWLCPLRSAICTQTGTNQFTNGGIVTPGTYSGAWISINGSGSVPNGYMSFYSYNANLPAGTYSIGCAADDQGWLYVNNQYLGTCSGSSVSSYSYNSNGGFMNIMLAVINNCPTCSADGNPSGGYVQVVNPSGQVVLTTSTNWKASTSPANFGYVLACPSGYNYDASKNACVSNNNNIYQTCTLQKCGWWWYDGEWINEYRCYNYNYPSNQISYVDDQPYVQFDSNCNVINTWPIYNKSYYVNEHDWWYQLVPSNIPVGGIGHYSEWNGSGYVWFDNNSESVYNVSSPTASCPNGGLYSSVGNYCYAVPTGLSFGLQCPLGNYTCLPNGEGSYSCSPLTCAPVNQSTVEQVPVANPNDKTDNGQKDDKGNCLGTVYIFNGKTYDCREAGVETGFSNCCSSSKTWFGLGKCWQNEQELQQKKEAKFCHYTGTYCSAKFLGVCLQKVEAYCCFNGVLARIIQEQGRYQGLPENGWGPSDDPHCEGFTPEQFQELDWSKIDMSEYYSYIETTLMPKVQSNINKGLNNAINKLQEGYQNQ